MKPVGEGRRGGYPGIRPPLGPLPGPRGLHPSPTPGPQRGRGCDPGSVSYKGGIFQHWGTLGSVT